MPSGTNESKVALREAINLAFGSFAEFKKCFEDEGAKLFRS